MKRIILSLIITLGAFGFAQAQVDGNISTFAQLKQWEKAKDELDKALNNPKLKEKDKPLLMLWKVEIYSEFYLDATLYAKYPDAEVQALNALNDYKKIDPSMQTLKDQNFLFSVNNLYSQSINYGNDGLKEQDWTKSYKYFSTCLTFMHFMNDNGLLATKISVDTITTLYTAYAAQNAKMLPEAAKYYQELADIKLGGKDYEDIYKFLLTYYSETNPNDDSFNKYLAIAKELYPEDAALWNDYEMNKMTAGLSVTDLMKKYLEEKAAGTLNEEKIVSYAQELATADKDRLEGLDSATKMELKKVSAEAFGTAYNLNSSMGLYAFNAGVVYYGIYDNLSDRYASYRGEGKDLAAKRTAIENEQKGYADTAIFWLEKAYTTLKAKTDRTHPETTSLNRTCGYLSNLYAWKRDKTKGADPKNYDIFDAKYKQYDAEYDTFK